MLATGRSRLLALLSGTSRSQDVTLTGGLLHYNAAPRQPMLTHILIPCEALPLPILQA